MSATDHAQFRQAYLKSMEAVRRLHEAGVELHSGTDAPAEFIVPGAGLIEELELLQATGLSAEAVLRISAVDTPRRLLAGDATPLGVGARADFVVYARDPTRDLRNLSSRTAVVVDGRFYSREQLEGQLRRYRQWFDSTLYRLLTESVVGAGLWVINALSAAADGNSE
jgi:imidazolonepropionase-like amidohydrolase